MSLRFRNLGGQVSVVPEHLVQSEVELPSAFPSESSPVSSAGAPIRLDTRGVVFGAVAARTPVHVASLLGLRQYIGEPDLPELAYQ